MQDPPHQQSKTDVLTVVNPIVSPELLVSLATGPLLLVAIAARRLGGALQTAGIASEQVFRGDRLPPLSEGDFSPKD